MSDERYCSEEAKATREAAANVKRLTHEFGDPNTGDYRDPFEYPTQLVVAQSRDEYVSEVHPRDVEATPMEKGEAYSMQ